MKYFNIIQEYWFHKLECSLSNTILQYEHGKTMQKVNFVLNFCKNGTQDTLARNMSAMLKNVK